MATMTGHMTPLKLIRAIERLSDDERETLAIMADKKLSGEILKRRKSAATELKDNVLLGEKELFGKG